MANYQKGNTAADFVIIEIRQVQMRKSYMGLSSNLTQVGFSRLHLFKKTQTVRDIRLRLFEIVRPLMGLQPVKSRAQLEKDYDERFKKPDGSYKVQNQFYDVEIQNNLPD